MTRSRFLERQHRFFADADPAHFFWQTQNPYVVRTERQLLEGFPLEGEHAILELGCGEGGNLVNLLAGRATTPRLVVGSDLFERKLAFARGQGVPARFVCADALALPFRTGAFEAVLCRDLLHHLEDQERALTELRRVCKPAGTVWVIEPNGRNPLVQGLALVRPHERGQLRNSIESLTALLARHFADVEIDVRQPFPLHRCLLHYQFGFPRLASRSLCRALLDALDRAFTALWPRRAWAYIVARLRVPPAPPR